MGEGSPSFTPALLDGIAERSTVEVSGLDPTRTYGVEDAPAVAAREARLLDVPGHDVGAVMEQLT
jgi:hypothetical protein